MFYAFRALRVPNSSLRLLLANVVHNVYGPRASICSSCCLRVKDDRKIWLKSLPPRDEGTVGAKFVEMDPYSGGVCSFPTVETPNTLFNGQVFSAIPILRIVVSRNNTKFFLQQAKGSNVILQRSCGSEGFKNCRKGTNVAAMTTSLSLSKLMLQKGFDTVRVIMNGLGPGRASSIEGLVAGGINIVSITEGTSFSENPPRPRKARRL